MARTNNLKVKQIIETDLDDVTPFIEAANAFVTKRLGSSSELSDTQLEQIERWVAAHFLAMSKERQTTKERMGDTEFSYNWNTKDGLAATTYGQTAMVLDTTGDLASAGKPGIIFDVAMDLPTDTD